MAFDIAALTKLLGSAGGLTPVGAAASAIPELFKAGLGVKQAITGHQLGKTKRPGYEIPDAMKQAMQTAYGMANDTSLPGQAQIGQQIGATTASGQRALNETGMGSAERMAALTGLYGNQQNQMASLGVQAAQQQNQDLQNLQSMLQRYAEEQRAQRDWNVTKPYLDKMAAAKVEKDAANKNLYSAGKGLAGITSMIGQGGSTKAPASSAKINENMSPMIKAILSGVDNAALGVQAAGQPALGPSQAMPAELPQLPAPQFPAPPGVNVGVIPTQSSFNPGLNNQAMWDWLQKIQMYSNANQGYPYR